MFNVSLFSSDQALVPRAFPNMIQALASETPPSHPVYSGSKFISNFRPVLLVLLAVAFFLQSFFASRIKSPGWDEPFHVATALLYVETGRIVRVTDHTPLLREISGLFMRAAGIRLPSTADAEAAKRGEGGMEYALGNATIHENGADRVLFWARLPFILMGTALVFVVYWVGARLVGQTAALGAAFLCAFDPIMLSNSALIYTDLGLALFEMLFLGALWSWIRQPQWPRVLWAGLALGATLASKYSSGILIPATALLILAARLFPVGEFRHKNLWTPALALVGIYMVAFVFLQFVYLFPADPLEYAKGLSMIKTGLNPNYLFYMAGQYSRKFYSYFVVAWLLKEPLTTVIAVGIGVGVIARSQKVTRLACLFLVIPAAAMLAGYTLFAGQLGVRYIVPVLPFGFIAGGAGLAALFQSAALWKKAAGGVLCLWLMLAAAGIYPDHMNYFNEAACLPKSPAKIGFDGGTRCGPEWLDDSNVDNGQALKQVKVWIDNNAGTRPVYFGYFGSYVPAWYGIPHQSGDYLDILAGTKPGLYIVSAHIMARAHGGAGSPGGAWLLKAQPIAVIGHSYYVFEIK